jgi:2-hydroxy-6-oxonona-2,4-dienedioate hydrolase
VTQTPDDGLKDRWTSCAAGTLYSRTNRDSVPGNYPVVILVHGLVISSRYMVPTAERLSPLCRVFAVDLPGYGKSVKPRTILPISDLADALAAWMEAERIEKAHLVGNSFGCQIIAAFAVQHPGRVDRIVLQGPTVDPQARSLLRQLIRLWINSRREAPRLGRITRRDYMAAGLRRAWASIGLALNDRIEERLPRIQAPALVVRGTEDPLVPRQWAERVVALLPNGRLHEIPNVAHTINYSAPQDFVHAMAPFLGLDHRAHDERRP